MTTRPQHTRPPTEAELRALRALCERVGDARAAAALGLTIETTVRLLACRPTRPGSVAILRLGLAAVAA